MFTQALANGPALGSAHRVLAPTMIGPLPVASLVVLFLVHKLEDVALAGFACLIAAVAVWPTERVRGARERLMEARA